MLYQLNKTGVMVREKHNQILSAEIEDIVAAHPDLDRLDLRHSRLAQILGHQFFLFAVGQETQKTKTRTGVKLGPRCHIPSSFQYRGRPSFSQENFFIQE